MHIQREQEKHYVGFGSEFTHMSLPQIVHAYPWMQRPIYRQRNMVSIASGKSRIQVISWFVSGITSIHFLMSVMKAAAYLHTFSIYTGFYQPPWFLCQMGHFTKSVIFFSIWCLESSHLGISPQEYHVICRLNAQEQQHNLSKFLWNTVRSQLFRIHLAGFLITWKLIMYVWLNFLMQIHWLMLSMADENSEHTAGRADKH